MRRLRILWIVLGALLLVSVAPLWLYHRQALRLSEEKLQDTERVQQSEITRSLASETLQFEQSLREQLLSQRQMLALAGWIQDVDDPTHAPQVSRLLQDFVENNSNILYVTAVNKEAKGPTAGSISADHDPFVDAALKRAFTSSIQGFDSVSDPFALGKDNRPALVMSVPLLSDGQFAGMFAAVVSLDRLESPHAGRQRSRSHRLHRRRARADRRLSGHARIGSGTRCHSNFAARKADRRIAHEIARHGNHEFLGSRQGQDAIRSR